MRIIKSTALKPSRGLLPRIRSITSPAFVVSHRSPYIPSVQRRFIRTSPRSNPAEMSKREAPDYPGLKHPSTKRAKEVDADLPYDQLKKALENQQAQDGVSKVGHWFRSKDLRIQDNISLHNASSLAQKSGKALVCVYLFCAAEFAWHGTSPARTDFILENLRIMQDELRDLGIPLVIINADSRKEMVPAILKFIADNKVSHVFANYEYEVDELRRDTKSVCQSDGKFHMALYHDQCVMEPGTMKTGSGGPMKVFTPYHKAWLVEVKGSPELISTVPSPQKQDSSLSKELSPLFDSKIPDAPKEKQFASSEERDRIRKLWPAGHNAGIKRMDTFMNKHIEEYAATRSNPAKNSTSRMSAYFSAGVVSIREALSKIQKYNSNSSDFSPSGSSAGVTSWVREIVFRELYRQTTLTTPHTVMNLPTNLKFNFVNWEDDEEGWRKWKEGKTGVPFVDAGMRQLNHEAYMHNRLRMNVSSYLYCNLLLDYRRGERYFAETLIDWDLSNNTQGWEPSYTVFNPTSQAEKNDPNGEYIRKWVPELKGVKGKAVFEPHSRLGKAEFEKLGYPEPHVDWKETKKRAMERFKGDMADVVP